MYRIRDEIIAVDGEHSLGIRSLPEATRDQLRESVCARYGCTGMRLWETPLDCVYVQNSDAWEWITDFVAERDCVLLFDFFEEVEMFHVPSGLALDTVLANSYHFEFYVTDMDATYLIGFNHHDFLVCCGTAKAWLKRRLDLSGC